MSPQKNQPTSAATGDRPEVLQGTLDMLILRVLSPEPMHGWAISKRIQQVSRDVILVHQGSLYPSLHRLQRKGLLSSTWGTSENNRRAKFYSLTKAGIQHLGQETESWQRLSGAVTRILREA